MRSKLRCMILFAGILQIAPLLFDGCSTSIHAIEESARIMYIRSGYEPSYQKCISFLSKESYLITHADKSAGKISTGYKTIGQHRTYRLDLHLKKISEDSTRAVITIYTLDRGDEVIVQEQEPYRELITNFYADVNAL